jgi:hypothetical protein
MSNESHQSCVYLNALFRDHERVVDNAIEALSPHRGAFDLLVGTGLSGTALVGTLARVLQKKFAIVRKGEKCHSQQQVEGCVSPGDRWIWIDDFTCSGKTQARVHHMMSTEVFTYGKDGKVPVPVVYAGRYLWVPGKQFEMPNPIHTKEKYVP